jgi:hypothetical protein
MTGTRRWILGGLGLALAVVGIGAGAVATGVVRTGPTALPAPRLIEVAAEAGLDHRYDGDYEFFTGGGVAAFDCDDDRDPDLYLAGGAGPAGLYRNLTDGDGALRFEAAGDETTGLTDVTGAYPLDIDGDDVVDLVVLRYGESRILRGLGDCRFEDAGADLDIAPVQAWTAAFSASWETPDAHLPTLAFGSYQGLVEQPNGLRGCDEHRLYRPAADGSAGYDPPTMFGPGLCALSMLFSDWDRSGRRDLRVSNDRQYHREAEEQLFRIDPGSAPRAYARENGWMPLRLWGMGIASQDLTGDGLPEVYLTSQGDNKLQTLASGPQQPTYEDIAFELGVTAHRPAIGDGALASTAWHPAFEDLNDDGFFDLYLSKGNVEAQEGYALEDPSDLFLGQPDGTFAHATEAAGMVDMARARGAAVVDLDLDGRLDIVSVVRREPVRIWHNTGVPEAAAAATHWLGIDLEQDSANHDAIGAWLAIRVGDQVVERELTVGGGHASGTLGPIHVGLGPATTADVRVTWPDGEVGPWQPVAADQYVTLRRGATGVEVWTR